MKDRCSGTATTASTLFPVLWCYCPWVLLGAQTLGKLFFSFFEPRITRTARIPENVQPGPFDPGYAGRAINYVLSAKRHGRGAGVGRGRGVGAGLGVGVCLGVDVAVGVADADAVAVAVGVAVAVAVGVALGVGDAVGVGLGVAPARLNAPIRNRHPMELVVGTYSLMYQKVVSSVGSMSIAE